MRSIEDPRVAVSDTANFLTFFGLQSANLPTVTIDSALTVPAVSAAVTFLSRCLANLPLQAFRTKEEGAQRIKGGIDSVLNQAPNDEWTSFGWRCYFWQQVFTGGRGLSWIERSGTAVVNIWPMDHAQTVVKRIGGQKFYDFDGRLYPARDVIDVPFMLKRDQLSVYSPIIMGAKAIQLALAMNDYASSFFAGGGVPPLALVGPLPAGPDAMSGAVSDLKTVMDNARKTKHPVFPIPPGYKLEQVGFDPAKGQMNEARLLQLQEIARIYGLPPMFLQDLSKGTFTNTEQQDLHLVKHVVAQWAKALEEELNLKVFGRRNNGRYAEHNLNALMRGDFKSRIEAMARGIQTAQLTPDEARALENRGPKEHGDKLYIQGATVPLGSQPTAQPSKMGHNGGPPMDDDTEPDQTVDNTDIPPESGDNDDQDARD